MELGDVKALLKGSEYEASAECIAESLAKYGVTTIAALDNATSTFGTSICRHSIWELVAYLRKQVLHPPVIESVEKVIPKKKRITRKKIVKVEDKGE